MRFGGLDLSNFEDNRKLPIFVLLDIVDYENYIGDYRKSF